MDCNMHAEYNEIKKEVHVESQETFNSLAVLSDVEINRYKNIYAAHEIIPRVFRLILKWSTPKVKPPNLNYYDFYKEYMNVDLSKQFLKPEVERLQSISDDGVIDATLLFKLIQNCGMDLKSKKDLVWYEGDESSFEFSLFHLKEMRNDICHNLGSLGTSKDVFMDIIRLCERIVKHGAEKYDLNEEVMVNELNDISSIKQIIEDKEGIRKFQYAREQFWKEGLAESELYWKLHCTSDVILFSGEKVIRDKVYHPLHVSIRALSMTTNPTMVEETVSYSKVIEPWSDEEQFKITIVKGEAGSGKSTLLKNIAQQFYKLTKREINSLDKYHFIHFLECKNRSACDLQSFIKYSFPKSSRKLGVREILNCFDSLHHLIFIDGFDERNEASLKLIRDILKRDGILSNNQIIITTRPHSITDLKELLDELRLPYRTCEILPITEESQQIEFLKRYHVTMNSAEIDNSENLIEAFKTLTPEVKHFFIFPINLLLFFHLYQNSDDKTKIFGNVSDIAPKIIYHYRMFLKRKIGSEGLKNIDLMLTDIIDEVCSFAFISLKEDKIIVADDDLSNLTETCKTILIQYGHDAVISIESIYSVLFLSRCPPNPRAVPSYQFFHKSIQEIFASRALFEKLSTRTDESISDIYKKEFSIESRDEETVILNKFTNVFKFTILELHKKENKQFISKRVPEFCQLLQRCSVNFKYCAELLSACLCTDLLAKEIVHASGIFWGDRSGLLLPATSKMLEYHQPQQLRAFFPKKDSFDGIYRKFLETVKLKHTGVFVLEMASFYSFIPCDDIWSVMKGAKCQLARFRACLESKSAVRILSKLSKRKIPDLHISLKDPMNHNLHELKNQKNYLTVTISYSDEWPQDLGNAGRIPLPIGSQPPWLIVTNVPEGGATKAVNVIVHLAPVNKKFRELELQNTALTEESLNEMLKLLQLAEITTTNSSERNKCFWKELKGKYGQCWICGSKVHQPSKRCLRFTIRKDEDSSTNMVTEKEKVGFFSCLDSS